MKAGLLRALGFVTLCGALATTLAGDAQGLSISATRARLAILDFEYDDAADILEGDDEDPEAAIEMARLALYRGDCDLAQSVLQRPTVADLDEAPMLSIIAKGCARATAATVVVHDKERHVLVRFHDDADRALMPLIASSAAQIRDALERDLGTRLPDPVFIDLVRDQLALAAHTGLPEEAARTTGTVAVAKWGRVLMLSPRATERGYPWLDTLAHEMTHLVLSQSTRDRAPLWLQEGVAKRQETRWRDPQPFDNVPSSDAVAAIGIQKGLGLELTKLGPSIAMLPSAEQARVAFAEVHSFIEFWVDEVGADAMPKLLEELRNGGFDATASDAIKAVSGADLAAWDKRWRAHLASKRHQLAPEFAPGGAAPKGGADAARHRRLGELMAERGHWEQAEAQFARAFEFVPRDPFVRSQWSHSLRQLGEPMAASELVSSTNEIAYESGRWWSLHGYWHDDPVAGQRALALDPYNVHVACGEFAFGLPPIGDEERRALCEAARNMPR